MAVRCPFCQLLIGSSPELAGKRVMCPQCANHFIMRAEPPNDERQVAVAPPIRTHSSICVPSRVLDMRRKRVAGTVFASAFLVGLIFVSLGCASDPPLDLIQYVGLIGIFACADTWVFSMFPSWSAWRTPAVVLCVAINVAAIGMWGYFDTEQLVRDKGNCRVVETRRRFRPEMVYRKVLVYDDNANWVGTLQGPTAESGSAHGHWEAIFASPALDSAGTWYWYGEEVSEGEWQRRIRGG